MISLDRLLPSVDTLVAVVAIVAIFVALLVLVATALGIVHPQRDRRGAGAAAAGHLHRSPVGVPDPGRQRGADRAAGPARLARSAVDLVGKVVAARDFAESIDVRLEAAGLPMRTAEWLLLHVGGSVGARRSCSG